jgi:hypothetical protein
MMPRLFFPRSWKCRRLLEGLTLASTFDDLTASAVMERFDDLECLKFLGWCFDHSPEWLSRFLLKLNMQPEKVERIAAFATKYSGYSLFLTRLNRTNNGYENEITRLSSRPSIQTFGSNAMVTLRLYNYDRLLLTSNTGVEELVELISMLMQVANDAMKSISDTAPELLRDVLDPKEVTEILERVDTLRKFVEGIQKEAKQSG